MVKKERAYLALITKRLKYCDLTNYLAAGTSLDKFYAAYKVKSPKGNFPYESFNSLERLKDTALPKRSSELRKAMDEGNQELIVVLSKKDPYFSILKQKTITNEQVDICEQEWKNQGMQNFGDFVKYYNDLDVLGLVEGIVKMNRVYQEEGLNMFKDAVSLPKLTQKLIFGPLDEENYFTVFSKKHDYIYKELRAGIVGGPSIIFNRWQEKDKTKIRNNEMCHHIEGYDCNSLYLWAMGLPQCTGIYCLREKSKKFQKHSKHDKNFILYSQKAINWLESIEKERNIKIRHAENHAHGEKRIGNCYLDGYHDGTIFEFLGCKWHGHKCNEKYPAEKWEETQKRLTRFRDMGYKVEAIWECEWGRDATPTKPRETTTEKEIETGIMEDEIFGIVKCDIKVPKYLEERFSEFPIIFKNTEIKLEKDIVGEHMYDYAQSIGRTKGVARSLISSMFGDGIVILTTLFKKYIQMGLICTGIEWVLEYDPKPVFKWFVDKVADNRRRADFDQDKDIIGETWKTMGNASYGYCCIDKSKHNKVKFVEQDEISRHVRDPFFKNIEELGGGIYEVVKGKRKVIQDTPVQVAIAVYSMAKFNLIQFWEFLNEHLDQNLYCLMETDTDSLYLALARSTIDECVRPEKLQDWWEKKYKYFASDSEKPIMFDGKEITEKQYQKRTPGLYKLEFSGEGMICLNSKVYHLWGKDKNGIEIFKTSSKGMQERNNLIREDFMSVLEERKEHKVQNAGFIREGTQTYTYTQDKKGLNYFYCKRVVLSDGTSTTHLNI